MLRRPIESTHFTIGDFTRALLDHRIRIMMDGQGCWRANIFVEGLWRTIKYEEVYLHAYATVAEARAGLGRYLALYDTRRHLSLADGTPTRHTSLTLRSPLGTAA